MEAESVGLPNPESVFASVLAPENIELQPFGVLTTTDEIRAVFGLSSAELPNDMLTEPIYVSEVKELILRVRKELLTDWDSLKNDRLLELVKRLALYCICDALSDVLPLIAAKTLTDSKSSFQRYSVDLDQVVQKIKVRLNKAINALKNTQKTRAVPTLIGNGSPNYDPVTG